MGSTHPRVPKFTCGPRTTLVSKMPVQETTYGHRDPGADARHPGAGQSRSDDQPSGHGDEVDGRLVGGGVGHHLEIKSSEEENGEGPEVGGEGDEVGSGERWSPEERKVGAL